MPCKSDHIACLARRINDVARDLRQLGDLANFSWFVCDSCEELVLDLANFIEEEALCDQCIKECKQCKEPYAKKRKERHRCIR